MISRFLIFVVAVVLSGTTWAATQQNTLAWDDLSADEQQLLQPYEE
jgi:hypothetical protein